MMAWAFHVQWFLSSLLFESNEKKREKGLAKFVYMRVCVCVVSFFLLFRCTLYKNTEIAHPKKKRKSKKKGCLSMISELRDYAHHLFSTSFCLVSTTFFTCLFYNYSARETFSARKSHLQVSKRKTKRNIQLHLEWLLVGCSLHTDQ